MTDEQLAAVLSLLREQSTITVATTDAAGNSAAAPLFYWLEESAAGFALYWFSSGSTQHSRNIEISPQIAAAVFHTTMKWREIRGAQMKGLVSVVESPALREQILQDYCARFELGTEFTRQLGKSKLYKFVPDWVRFVNNADAFGIKFESFL